MTERALCIEIDRIRLMVVWWHHSPCWFYRHQYCRIWREGYRKSGGKTEIKYVKFSWNRIVTVYSICKSD